MEKIVYTAQVTSIGGRTGHIRSSDHVLDMDLSISDGFATANQQTGTNPEQLFAGAYAACFESTILAIAAQEKTELRNTSVTARVHLVKGQGYSLRVELDVSLPGIKKEESNRLLHAAHQQCPYSKAIENNVNVKTVLV